MLMGMAKLLLWNANSWTRISTPVVDKDPPLLKTKLGALDVQLCCEVAA